jgi:hypothetical protein
VMSVAACNFPVSVTSVILSLSAYPLQSVTNGISWDGTFI